MWSTREREGGEGMWLPKLPMKLEVGHGIGKVIMREEVTAAVRGAL